MRVLFRDLSPLLLAIPLLLAACGGGSSDDPHLPPPFYLTAQFDVADPGQPPVRSTLTWWFDRPGRWRYDLDSGAHDTEPPATVTVFGVDDAVVIRNGESEERIEMGMPARPRLFSSLFLGPVEGQTVAEFVDFVRTELPDSDIQIVGQEIVLGRATTIVEIGPAFRGEANGAPTANGSVRYWIDESTMLILRAELDSDEAYALAEVTALDLDPTFPPGPFFDPDA